MLLWFFHVLKFREPELIVTFTSVTYKFSELPIPFPG